MKVLYLGSNEKKNPGKELNKIEARFSKRKQKINSLKVNVKMLEENLIICSKYRQNIEKCIFGKLISLTFLMKKLRNLQAGGVKTRLM